MKDKRTFFLLFILVLVLTITTVIFPNRNNSKTTTEQKTEQKISDKANDQKKEAVTFSPVSENRKEFFNYETEFFDIQFCTAGASISSMKMKNYKDSDGKNAEIVFRGENDRMAFLMYWGKDFSIPVTDNFNYRVEADKVVFTNEYVTTDGKTFSVIKTFQFKPQDYLIKVSVDFTGEVEFNGEYGYSIAFEPQVGPEFETLGRYEYRRQYLGIYKKTKVKKSLINLTNNFFENSVHSKWISVTGKYFTVIAIPADETPVYKYSVVRGTGDIAQTDSFYISVPSEESKAEKSFYFYCGPQLKTYLGRYYNSSNNQWGLKNLNLDDAMESGSFLGWLENFFKWCLSLIYKIIPNYGVAIIILTFFIKLATWPIQGKGMAASQKMSALSPMVEEIKKKYPNNPQKQNVEMQKMYQQYGISPLGGCLPLMLQFLQFPILIGFYGLLNRHIELRGAVFIRGWIEDLSVPETVVTIPLRLPFLGNQIHLLPFLYIAVSVLTVLYTQRSNPVNVKQSGAWLMTWGLPVIFFFVLYSAPSGIFVYWIFQGILNAVQQFIMNNKKKKTGPIKLEKINIRGKK